MINETTHATPERWKALSLFLVVSMAIASTTLAADQKKGFQKKDAPQAATEAARPLPALTTQTLPAVGGSWTAQGPGPIRDGQVEGITNRPVIGAISAVVAHPTNAGTLWVGSVNGGIWKTTNATSASPTWAPQTDTFPSLSIANIDLDPTDATRNTLVAGTGNESSYGVSGPIGAFLRTTDGGASWSALNSLIPPSSPFPLDLGITGIAARGSTIVVSVADCFTGLWRSTNTGGSFSIISGPGTGLPSGTPWAAYDLAGDPNNNAVLYAALTDCTSPSSISGIYKSTDTGASWTRVSDAAMNSLMTNASNAEISVGASGQVYVGIVSGFTGQLAGIFRSGNGGSTWIQLDTPTTIEDGNPYGIHPGGQGSLHFSVAAHPTNANLVYVGGDRQPLFGLSSIGAGNYTGRLFRVNAAAASGSQATPLTHCQTALAGCNGSVSTNNNSAPHADSRAITFDANGNLIETDDGGIYRRTSPSGTGDWFSVNGNLQITEMHNVVYDRISNMIIGGSQDNGTSEQTAVGGSTWTQVSGGDGGDVSADDTTAATHSSRYSSYQYLGGFFRRIVNSSGVTTSWIFPSLTVVGGGDGLVGQFTTPVELNRIDPRRILFAGYNDLYESLDRGDTITALGLNQPVQAMAYGGRASGVDNLDVIYAISYQGADSFGPNVFVRTSGGGAPVQTSTSPGTDFLRDIAADVTDWGKAYVVNRSGQVFSTSNAGASWTDITGNLGSGTTDLWTIVHIPGNPSVIAVGGVNGVFRMATNNPGVWNQLGTGMSNSVVYDLDYDPLDDTIVAGTLGRGAWKLSPVAVSGILPKLAINDVTVTEGNAGTTNATFTVSLTPSTGHSVGVDYATNNVSAAGQSTTTANNSSISIPDSGNGSPYPSTINVSGITGSIGKVTVTLYDFEHTFNADVDVLLVGPGGQTVVLMSDAGGNQPSFNLDLTFDDAAASQLPELTAFGSLTYRPANFDPADTYSSPAPSGPHGTTLSVFGGASPNGTWRLYVVDDAGSDEGGFWGGWSLTFTTGDYSPTSGTLIFPPGVTSRTISVTVHGDTTTEANETLVMNLFNNSNATFTDAQGIGTITNDDGVAPPTNVVATATSTTNVNINWTAVVGASTYRVYRSSGGAYTQVGETSGTSFNDGTASANTAYLYKVRSVAGTESADSNIDLATAVIFTDPTIMAGTTPIKLAHFDQLRTAVNAVRLLASLSGFTFTAPTPGTTVTIRAVHMNDLRNALTPARSALNLPPQNFAETITPGTTGVKAAHINEVRNGVQ